MAEYELSRRRFLAVAGLGTAAALGACALSATPAALSLSTSKSSPATLGPYQTGRLILGEDAGTAAMPNPFKLSQMPAWALADRPSNSNDSARFNAVCQNGQLVDAGELPRRVLAAVYYPVDPRADPSILTPNPLGMSKGPYPVLLYAHGFRPPETACIVASPLNRDFTSVETMLRHVASWGCVCVVPDLSWLPGLLRVGDPDAAREAFDLRAVVLVDYYTYLADVLNTRLFAKQLDFSRVVLVGHSTGAGGATHAGSIIAGFSHPTSLSYGLIAPVRETTSSDVHSLLVLRGSQDTLQGGIDPLGAFAAAGISKTLATIPGANHFGYTDICPPDNSCGRQLFDQNGAISRADQQQVGAEYLAALVRYYALGETNLVSFLNGSVIPDSLKSLNLQVQAKGFIVHPEPQDTHTPVAQP